MCCLFQDAISSKNYSVATWIVAGYLVWWIDVFLSLKTDIDALVEAYKCK